MCFTIFAKYPKDLYFFYESYPLSIGQTWMPCSIWVLSVCVYDYFYVIFGVFFLVEWVEEGVNVVAEKTPEPGNWNSHSRNKNRFCHRKMELRKWNWCVLFFIANRKSCALAVVRFHSYCYWCSLDIWIKIKCMSKHNSSAHPKTNAVFPVILCAPWRLRLIVIRSLSCPPLLQTSTNIDTCRYINISMRCEKFADKKQRKENGIRQNSV